MRDTLGAGCARAASGAVTTASKKEATAARVMGPMPGMHHSGPGWPAKRALHARARWTLVIRVVPEPRSPGRPASGPIRPKWKNADVIRPGGPVRRSRLRTVSSEPQATIASTSWSLPPSTKSAGLSPTVPSMVA